VGDPGELGGSTGHLQAWELAERAQGAFGQHACEDRSKTVMRPGAESEMVAERAGQVEAVGIRKGIGIAVSGSEDYGEHVSLADGFAAKRNVLDGSDGIGRLSGRVEAQAFFNGGGKQIGVRAELRELIRKFEKSQKCAGNKGHARCVASGEDCDEKSDENVVGEQRRLLGLPCQ
jgi:hypothetical protein